MGAHRRDRIDPSVDGLSNQGASETQCHLEVARRFRFFENQACQVSALLGRPIYLVGSSMWAHRGSLGFVFFKAPAFHGAANRISLTWPRFRRAGKAIGELSLGTQESREGPAVIGRNRRI